MFDSEQISKFEYLSLVTRKAFTGQTMAGHRNSQMCGGVEFADYRNYVFGDDLRHLDWNVYARLGTSLIKRFQEEGDLHVYCCLDVSRSMNNSTSLCKFTYAKQVIAALAYISLSRFDYVSLLSFTGNFEKMYPPVRGKQHFLPLTHFLEDIEIADGQTNFDTFTKEFLRRTGTPGLVLLVSDFYDKNGLDRMLDRLLSRKFEPVILQIYDPEEAAPSLRGDYCFTDAETGITKKVTVNEASLKRYKQCFQNFKSFIQSSCRKHGCFCHSTSIDVPFDRFILEIARNMAALRS